MTNNEVALRQENGELKRSMKLALKQAQLSQKNNTGVSLIHSEETEKVLADALNKYEVQHEGY